MASATSVSEGTKDDIDSCGRQEPDAGIRQENLPSPNSMTSPNVGAHHQQEQEEDRNGQSSTEIIQPNQSNIQSSSSEYNKNPKNIVDDNGLHQDAVTSAKQQYPPATISSTSPASSSPPPPAAPLLVLDPLTSNTDLSGKTDENKSNKSNQDSTDLIMTLSENIEKFRSETTIPDSSTNSPSREVITNKKEDTSFTNPDTMVSKHATDTDRPESLVLAENIQQTRPLCPLPSSGGNDDNISNTIITNNDTCDEVLPEAVSEGKGVKEVSSDKKQIDDDIESSCCPESLPEIQGNTEDAVGNDLKKNDQEADNDESDKNDCSERSVLNVSTNDCKKIVDSKATEQNVQAERSFDQESNSNRDHCSSVTSPLDTREKINADTSAELIKQIDEEDSKKTFISERVQSFHLELLFGIFLQCDESLLTQLAKKSDSLSKSPIPPCIFSMSKEGAKASKQSKPEKPRQTLEDQMVEQSKKQSLVESKENKSTPDVPMSLKVPSFQTDFSGRDKCEPTKIPPSHQTADIIQTDDPTTPSLNLISSFSTDIPNQDESESNIVPSHQVVQQSSKNSFSQTQKNDSKSLSENLSMPLRASLLPSSCPLLILPEIISRFTVGEGENRIGETTKTLSESSKSTIPVPTRYQRSSYASRSLVETEQFVMSKFRESVLGCRKTQEESSNSVSSFVLQEQTSQVESAHGDIRKDSSSDKNQDAKKEDSYEPFSLVYNECSIAAIASWAWASDSPENEGQIAQPASREKGSDISLRLSSVPPPQKTPRPFHQPVPSVTFRKCSICERFGHYEFECPLIVSHLDVENTDRPVSAIATHTGQVDPSQQEPESSRDNASSNSTMNEISTVPAGPSIPSFLARSIREELGREIRIQKTLRDFVFNEWVQVHNQVEYHENWGVYVNKEVAKKYDSMPYTSSTSQESNRHHHKLPQCKPCFPIQTDRLTHNNNFSYQEMGLKGTKNYLQEIIGEKCEVCGSAFSEDDLLMCDGCDALYHKQCLDPPLEQIPDEDWFCPKCISYDSDVSSIVDIEGIDDFVIEQRKRSVAIHDHNVLDNEKQSYVNFTDFGCWDTTAITIPNHLVASALDSLELTDSNHNSFRTSNDSETDDLSIGDLCWVKEVYSHQELLAQDEFWPGMVQKIKLDGQQLIFIVKVLGLSDSGGGVASEILSFYPHYEERGHKKLVNFSRKPWYPDFRRGMTDAMTMLGFDTFAQVLKKSRELIQSKNKKQHANNDDTKRDDGAVSTRQAEFGSSLFTSEKNAIDEFVILERNPSETKKPVVSNTNGSGHNSGSTTFLTPIQSDKKRRRSGTSVSNDDKSPSVHTDDINTKILDEKWIGSVVGYTMDSTSRRKSQKRERGKKSFQEVHYGVLVGVDRAFQKALVRHINSFQDLVVPSPDPTVNTRTRTRTRTRNYKKRSRDISSNPSTIEMHNVSLGASLWISTDRLIHVKEASSTNAQGVCQLYLESSLNSLRGELQQGMDKKQRGYVENVSILHK